jgi:hypothetical protein
LSVFSSIRSEQFLTFYDLAGVFAFLGEKDKAYDDYMASKKK